jgi:Fe-S oxidoreductase
MPLELTRSPWKLAPTASLHRRLAAVLEAIGERIAVPSSWACCGRPLYDAGMLGLARRTLTHLLDVLEPWTSRGIPVVVLEPSCLAAFRDELPAAAVTTYPGAPPGSTTEAS